jgi:hypothetical protein
VIVVVMLIAVEAPAQLLSEPTPTPTAQGPIGVGELAPTHIPAGASKMIVFEIRVAEGHRVQANPASSEFLVPLEIVIEDLDGLAFGSPTYPDPELYLLEGDDEPLLTYAGEFEVVVPVSVAAAAGPGSREVTGELMYQACNSRTCLFPSSLPLSFEVVVAATDEGPKENS